MFRARIWHLAILTLIIVCPYSTFAQIYFWKGNHACGARTPKEKVFLNAVNKRNAFLVQQLLQKGADPNARDDCGIPVITYAAELVDSNLVKLLISSGADVNSIDNFHRKPPLLWIIDSLFEDNENDVYIVVQLLISAGANVNLRGESNKPALSLAVEKENERLVKLLISAGADVNFKSDDDFTAYSHAAQIGNQKLKKILIEAGADPNIAVKKYQKMYGENAFFQAAADGRTDVVEAMLTSGMDVNMVNDGKMTALMRARDDSTVEVLLKAGADVNLRDKAGFTALIWAALFRNSNQLKQLIAAGADVNAQTPDGKTALDLVTDSEITEILIQAGARANGQIWRVQ